MEVGDDDAITYTGPFNYYPPAEVAYEPKPFNTADLSAVAAAAYAALRAVGITHFRVRYDGGHDEGFAHAEAGRTADGVDWPLDRLVAAVTPDGPIEALRATFGTGTVNSTTGRLPYYATVSPKELVELALDDLGDEMIVCLLGGGYGTGEYSMYGAVTADLTTGTLRDEPSVTRPPDVTFD